MTGCSVLRSLCPDALLQEAEGLQDLGQQFLITVYRGTSGQHASQKPRAMEQELGAGQRFRLQSLTSAPAWL